MSILYDVDIIKINIKKHLYIVVTSKRNQEKNRNSIDSR